MTTLDIKSLREEIYFNTSSDKEWIGEEENYSGSYYPTVLDGLSKRVGGAVDGSLMYSFTTRFATSYYITEPQAVETIRTFIETVKSYDETQEKEKEEQVALLETYLYNLIVQHFGMSDILQNLENFSQVLMKRAYSLGKYKKQEEILSVLGVQKSY